MPPVIECCETCKFWHRISDSDDKGYCYRYAPQPVTVAAKSQDIIHPITRTTEIACGDYAKK